MPIYKQEEIDANFRQIISARKCSYHGVEMIPTKVAPCFPESIKDDVDSVIGWLCPQCWRALERSLGNV